MRLLRYFNVFLVFCIFFALLLFFVVPKTDERFVFAPKLQVKELPKNPFAQAEDAYQEIGNGPLALKWKAPQMVIPDLRSEILFYGKNMRPDAKGQFHIALSGSGQPLSVCEREKVYLIYEGNSAKSIPAQEVRKDFAFQEGPLWGDLHEKRAYHFAPSGQSSSLWLEFRKIDDQKLEVRVCMLDEKGQAVTFPSECHNFVLNAIEFPKAQTIGWELGGFRVDSTLLVRQRARWIGDDMFFKMHGGEEYSFTEGRERIDFLDGEIFYSCFVKENDFLVWENDRWIVPKEDQVTLGSPLLVVKKIDDKILTFELWDAEGKGKIPLNLIRSRDISGFPDMPHEFKFVGAKTWAQFIVETEKGRFTLKPHDWLLLGADGWKKLATAEEIDDYVEGRLSGPLFVLDKLAKQNGKQVLIGHVFNSTRSEVQEVELPSAASGSGSSVSTLSRVIGHAPPIPPPPQMSDD